MPAEIDLDLQDEANLETNSSKILLGRLRFLIDIARLAEKDYLARNTPWFNRISAKILLFKQDWFSDVCSKFGINPDIARLHIIHWKSTGRVGDPVFSFLTRAGSYESFLRGNLHLPDLDFLLREAADYGSLNRKSRKSRSSPPRN